MRTIARRTYIVIFLVIAFFAGLAFMLYSFYTEGGKWASNRANSHIYSSGELTVAGTIYDRDKKALVSTKKGKRVYHDDRSTRLSTLHIIGDSQGFISTGVQTLYRSDLIGYNFVDGIYKTINSSKGNDIRLTVDAEVSAAAYKAMNGKKGTVMVYDYKTGQIVCMVSAPSYDPINKPKDIDSNKTGKYDGIYINRALTGVFTPGSTFKIVTAVCAIENIPDIYERKFTCKGKYTTGKGKGDGKVICNGTHGKLDFEKALNVSCNSVFAKLAIELGPEKLTETVRKCGFGKKISLGKISTVKSTFDLTGCTNLDLGWAGIGQYTTLINPCQMLMFMGAIANGGQAITPYLVEDGLSVLGLSGIPNSNITLSAETAEKVKKLMRSNVKNYYKDDKFPGLQMCGKTGSAEVSNGNSHAWFVGFSQKKNFNYAIVVCLENGGTGYKDAIPVANKVLQALKKADKIK